MAVLNGKQRIACAVRGGSLFWAGLAFLGALMLASIWLGMNRIFQVDEVHYAAVARFSATGRATSYATEIPFILVGPLTWIAGAARDSAEVLVLLRLPFVALMWANFGLMVKAAGFRLGSMSGLLAMLLASTLAPLWDYGFEIRHDVPLLTATLALFCLVRSALVPVRIRLVLSGAVAGLMQLIAFKGFMYSVPLLALGLMLARPRTVRQVLGHVVIIVVGLTASLLLGQIIFGLAGVWPMAWGTFQKNIDLASSTVERFSPWSLARLFSQAPLLACGSLAALVAPFLPPKSVKLSTILEESWFPAWFYAVVCTAMFFINPTPYPYNLIHLAPSLFILLMGFREQFIQSMSTTAPLMRRTLLMSMISLHAIPWALATSRHFEMGNDRQKKIIHLAEAMTDPAAHRVWDGSGLVSCRDPIGKHWLIHSFTIRHFLDGSWPTVRSLLALNPTPVILPNYRTAWLSSEDQTFMKNHYIPLAEDYMVLGVVLESGSSGWEALADGRYRMDFYASPSRSKAVFKLDGRNENTGILTLSKGTHEFEIPEGHQLMVAWVGPRLDEMPSLPPAPHPLFVNWY